MFCRRFLTSVIGVFIVTALSVYVEDGNATDASALKKAAEVVSKDIIRSYVEKLAGDEMRGRMGGTRYEYMASDYIAEQFESAGLKPIGDPGEGGKPTYFQYFDIRSDLLSRFTPEERELIGKGRNCVGLLEGSDPELKNEYIVVGAHHDHMGTQTEQPTFFGFACKPSKDDPEDVICNGADDNASGTSLVLMLVKAVAESGLKFKRSVIFMTYSAEELGFTGSRHYVENPLIPLEKTVVMINMDMVGGNKGKSVSMGGLGTAKGDLMKDIVKESVEKAGLGANLKDGFGGGSDHISFIGKNIPIISISSGMHALYNSVDDEPGYLDYERMEKTARSVVYILDGLGNSEEAPRLDREFKEKMVKQMARGRRPQGKLLGVYPATAAEEDLENIADLGEYNGGVVINQVMEGSVAEKAGIRAGDVIISFDGKSFSRDNAQMELRDYIKKAKYNKDIPLVIFRNGETVEITIRWEKKGRKKSDNRELEDHEEEDDSAVEEKQEQGDD